MNLSTYIEERKAIVLMIQALEPRLAELKKRRDELDKTLKEGQG